MPKIVMTECDEQFLSVLYSGSKMIIGYYVFLGSGDYHPPSTLSNLWISTWGFLEWKTFIDHLMTLNVNTILIYLNGHQLPYNSIEYPELIETDHPNIKNEFLIQLFDYIKEKSIDLIAVFTTTGHAGGFLKSRAELKIEVLQEDPNIEETLISFPRHMRKGKLAKKPGAAQLGLGVLCHNQSQAQQYAKNVISEVITLYGPYFKGIALHPPESAYPCVCETCCQLFTERTGKELKSMELKQQRAFFISSYLEFQANQLIALVKNKLPECHLFTFSIPWLFETVFEELSTSIPRDVTIIEWDYNLSLSRIKSLSTRLNGYISRGFKVLFMPTSGFSFDIEQSIEKQIKSVHEQLAIASSLDILGVAHFIGPKLNEYIVQTSLQTADESSFKAV